MWVARESLHDPQQIRHQKKKKRTTDRKQNKSRSKIKKKTNWLLVVFLLLQVTVFITVGEKRKKGRSRYRSPLLPRFSCGGVWTHTPPVVTAREPTRRQWWRRMEKTCYHCSGDPKASQHCSCDLGLSALFMILVYGLFFVNLNCLMCYLDWFEHWLFCNI